MYLQVRMRFDVRYAVQKLRVVHASPIHQRQLSAKVSVPASPLQPWQPMTVSDVTPY